MPQSEAYALRFATTLAANVSEADALLLFAECIEQVVGEEEAPPEPPAPVEAPGVNMEIEGAPREEEKQEVAQAVEAPEANSPKETKEEVMAVEAEQPRVEESKHDE